MDPRTAHPPDGHATLTLSVIVPVYNEAATIREILKRIVRPPFAKEIIVVDDGSTDGTTAILKDVDSLQTSLRQDAPSAQFNLKVLFHPRNQGKGASIRTALSVASGEIVLIQDADLEYNPADYPRLLAPILEGEADVVYGSRFAGSPRRVLLFWHTVGNKFLTFVSNLFTNLNLTDMETGYKVFRTEVLKSLRPHSHRFGFEPEVTAKIARRGVRIYEVPISYAGRTYAEGKKINWRDGVTALWAILRYNLIDDTSTSGEKTLRRVSRLSRYNAWLWEQIAPFTGQRILEVGAGIGTMTRYLLSRELVLATDVDCRYLERLRITLADYPNLVVRPFDLNDPPPKWLTEQRLDTILCLNVLEHIQDDETVLRHFFHLLPAGGRVILIVPALKRLYGTIDKAINHHRRYERAEIKEKWHQAGFEMEEARFFNLIGVFGWYLNSCLLKRATVPGVQGRFNDFLVPLLRLERHLTLPWGMSLMTVGRKA